MHFILRNNAARIKKLVLYGVKFILLYTIFDVEFESMMMDLRRNVHETLMTYMIIKASLFEFEVKSKTETDSQIETETELKYSHSQLNDFNGTTGFLEKNVSTLRKFQISLH